MVTQIGIEANPLKIKAILDMKAPTNVDEVQRLTGVKTNMPLGKLDTFGRLVKWSVELRASMEDTSKLEKLLLHVNGSSTIQSSGAGIVITSSCGENLESTVKFDSKPLIANLNTERLQ
ncbi:UNVERIFIED_CONTAM: hypothetical protein Scaly_0084800 [Sesamum calycinum]|uniref:Uncharacterized protein n=1 Tax=Sesamum calycinum TaxID=2727403 RepID=A0AAW2SW95_9LAMI